MNKVELLADLSGREWVRSLVGNPMDITPEDEQPTNLKWYRQAYFEVSPDNKVLLKQALTFYVLDEGEPAEFAAYQEKDPTPATRTSSFADWLDDTLAAEAVANRIDAWSVVQLSERRNQALIKALEEDPTEPGQSTVVSYLIRRLPNNTLWKKKINLLAEQILDVKL